MYISLLAALSSVAWAGPCVTNSATNVTYNGISRGMVEAFLGIRYAQDTGLVRFKPPKLYQPGSGSSIDATSYGPGCPQPSDSAEPPISFTNPAIISEDCLNLNIVRPNSTTEDSKLPVLLWIHGGSFWFNSNQEITNVPDALILRSVDNQTPIIHVAVNYRLGAFGFAASAALKAEGSENLGLRDQRMAIEWTRDNIAAFGGDPNRITIHGQSSGGLAVGMQILAYGGSKPVPFQQAICESQAIENGITGNFTQIMMKRLVDATGCNKTDIDSNTTIQCLRALDYNTLANASFSTYDSNDLTTNQGDSWLPIVDGDFVPAAPSDLLNTNRFANVTTMILWAENDMQLYTPTTLQTRNDSFQFYRAFLPGFTVANINRMLDLYPIGDYQANPSANLSAEFYRSAQAFRDLLMTCQPINVGQALGKAGNVIYYVSQNATILPPLFAQTGFPGLGAVHTSEFAYTFGNISHYDQGNFSVTPTEDDYRLEREEAGSWAAFTSVGQPSLYVKETLQGIQPAYATKNQTNIFIIGGPHEGASDWDGANATNKILVAERLRERCGFFNSAEIVKQLQY